VGEPLPTNTLPLAFAHAELRDTAGWKAQLDAAERLARAGAIDPGRLVALYTDRRPAASGGVWDRAAAVQDLEAALAAADAERLAAVLPGVWAEMAGAELEVPFAAAYADRLLALPFTGEAAALAFRIGLLSPSYAAAAAGRAPQDATEAFLIGLARGKVEGLVPPDSLARALQPAFVAPEIGPDFAGLLAEGRQGEALLMAVDRINAGVQGAPGAVAAGLAVLRRLGLEEAARRTALELLLLERRG
jgi:hypothetical protein